ncbi:MAG: transporter [Kiritimatiellaeota bacterium]|nr:transporter [Kiritimatiellota bacterium]
MKMRLFLSLAMIVLLGLTAIPSAQAQTPLSSHYSAGVEGLNAASLPPPGLYFRDYNYGYFADRFTAGPPDFNLKVYVQAPRLIWLSDYTLLGGTYGVDLLLPFVYQDLSFKGYSDHNFNMGDVYFAPLLLAWHPQQFDLAVSYGFWAPTGNYDAKNPISAGKGFWTHMLTAGATWHPDAEKTWSLSLLNRYEFNQENSDVGIRPGQTWTLEGGLAKSVAKHIELGLAGYFQQQTTRDSGANAADGLASAVGVGPEISAVCPYTGIMASFRWIHEISVNDRPQGNTFDITLTKRF